MGVAKQYYMNGASFALATSLYLDEALTTCAPDGFYSWGGVARELIGCVLSPVIECPDCTQTCGAEPISVWGLASGYYHTEFTSGDAVGAIVIEVTPGLEAMGVKVDYNGTTYNTLSSKTEGKLESTNATRPTYIGPTTAIWGPFSQTLDVFNYEEGVYVDTLVNEARAQLAADDQRTVVHPGKCFLIVPKISTTSDPIIVDFETMTGNTVGWTLKANCPALLTTFDCSLLNATQLGACGLTFQEQVQYHYPVNGTAGVGAIPGTVGLYDFVFNDPYGTLKMTDGFYKIDAANTMEVVDGIIVAITAC